MIYKPKEALIQFPSLWLPGSPLPSSRGLGRRCCCGCSCEAVQDIEEVSLTFSGIPNNECTDCSFLNTDIFVLSADVVPEQECRWDLILESPYTCAVCRFSVGVVGKFMSVDIWGLFGASSCVSRSARFDTGECSQIDNVELAFTSTDFTWICGTDDIVNAKAFLDFT